MSQPQLPRFEFTILKNKSVSDPAQVPSSGTVELRRQGASVSQSITIPVSVPTTVAVYDTGAIQTGDILQLNADPQDLVSVADVSSDTALSVLNNTMNPIVLNDGDRLVVSGSSPSQPQFYSDPMGSAGVGSSIAADATSGRVGGYIRSDRFDFLVVPTGESARLYADFAPRFDNPSIADVRTYGSIQAAIDALPPVGGTVYAPAANYAQTETIVIPVGKRVHLKGDGVGRTIISCSSADRDILWVKGSYSTIEDLTIQGPNATGKGRGIVLGHLAADSPTDVLRRVSIINCLVTQTASWSLYVIGSDEPGAHPDLSLSIWSHIERCVFRENKRAINPDPDHSEPTDPKHYEGLIWVGRGCTTQLFLNSACDFFVGYGVRAFGAYRVSFLESTFEDKLDDLVPYASFDMANNIIVSGCWFEAHQTVDVSQPFIDIGPNDLCSDVVVANSRFVRHKGSYPRLVRVASNSRAVLVSGPTCTMVAQLADDRFTTGWKDVDVATGCEAYVSGGVLTFQDNPKGLAVSGVAPVALPDSQLAPMQRWSPADWSSIEDRTGTKDVNTWGSGDPLTGNLVTSGRQAIYRIAAYLVSDPFTFTPQRIINVSISWQDLEGPRSALLISHPVSTNQKTITSAEKVILSAVGQPISYAITPDESGVEYRVYLRAEAV